MTVGLGFLLADACCRIVIPTAPLATAVVLVPKAAVEPHRRIEYGLLPNQDVGQFIMKTLGVFLTAEVASFHTPLRDGIGHAADDLPHAGLALRRTELAVKVLRSHNVGGRLRPVLGHFHVPLLENDFTLFVLDGG